MEGPPSTTGLVEQGHEALNAGDWPRAIELFEQAAAHEPNAAALDGLGQALWWNGEFEAGIETRARAFEAYRREGDLAAAGNVAIYLAGEYRIAGNASAANGWLGRGERLLEGCPDCSGRGWLEIERAKRSPDPAEAESHAREAIAIAQRLGDGGLEACGLSHAGHARLAADDEEGGLALLDEAMALATSTSSNDVLAVGDACCTTLVACERLADAQRARDWGRVITEYVDRRNFSPLSAWCRGVYASFLIGTGAWTEAEAELERALEEARRLPGGGHPTSAIVRLAELRTLQGRFEEAGQLIAGLEDRPEAIAAAVRLDLARGERNRARERVARRLEDADHSDAQRAALEALRAEVALALEDAEQARAAIEALLVAARVARRDELEATGAVLAARSARLAGEQVEPQALEAALERVRELSLVRDEGLAREELAHALRPTHEALAVEQAREALAIFERLGAAPDADRAAKLLRDLGAPGRPAPRGGELSRREAEVLRLLGAGLSNAEIAERLVISPRTAEHHVGAILRKLGLRNRAEAAAYVARERA